MKKAIIAIIVGLVVVGHCIANGFTKPGEAKATATTWNGIRCHVQHIAYDWATWNDDAKKAWSKELCNTKFSVPGTDWIKVPNGTEYATCIAIYVAEHPTTPLCTMFTYPLEDGTYTCTLEMHTDTYAYVVRKEDSTWYIDTMADIRTWVDRTPLRLEKFGTLLPKKYGLLLISVYRALTDIDKSLLYN